jgi:hypothetical protein
MLLARCLDGTDPASLLPAERASVIEAMEQRAPRLELELELLCPECERSFAAPFDLTAFFLHEMRLQGDRLLGEVHHLALYYHWSEAEILSLTRARRRKYLSLLSDSLRPE